MSGTRRSWTKCWRELSVIDMSVMYNAVSQYIPFLRKKPVISRDQALHSRPVRNPQLEWERVDGGDVHLRIYRRNDRVAKALCWMFRAPEYKEIVLDEVGSDIWELCNGERNVEAIVLATSKKYKLTRRECETSVAAYLKMLGDRKLIGFQLKRSGSANNSSDLRGKTADVSRSRSGK